MSKHQLKQCVHDLYDMYLSCVEKPLLEYVMAHTKGKQSLAAEYLGINRNTLRKKLQIYGLNKEPE